MQTFTINADNLIITTAWEAEAPSSDSFSTQHELAMLAATWPAGRLVKIWNALPGVAPVKKFTDRKTGLTRIWNAIQTISPDSADDGHAVGPPARQARKAEKRTKKTHIAQKLSKKDQVIQLLKRTSGATLEDLIKVTSWQPHTVRGFISGAISKRMSTPVQSSRREDGTRVYKVLS